MWNITGAESLLRNAVTLIWQNISLYESYKHNYITGPENIPKAGGVTKYSGLHVSPTNLYSALYSFPLLHKAF